ncbi:hypothetical protein [Erwinia tasmaniensis]|uniref:hypothetical protein n=1 Tax=Erwinia tasmaniensis TaxID=338565 RepID=UPI003A4E3BC5
MLLILLLILAILFILLFIVSVIIFLVRLSREGDASFRLALIVLILPFMAFYCAFWYVSLYLATLGIEPTLF